MKKRNNLVTALVVAVLALLFLWLRENEMRVAAEARLTNLRFKATSVINEKGDAIADLSTQVGDLQANLQKTTEEYNNTVADRDTQIRELNDRSRQETADHAAAIETKDQNIGALEEEMKQSAERYDASLKKKNTELSGMGEELRKSTERLAAALKDKEKTESENYDLKQSVSRLERKVGKMIEENSRLEGLSKLREAPATADGPAPKNTV